MSSPDVPCKSFKTAITELSITFHLGHMKHAFPHCQHCFCYQCSKFFHHPLQAVAALTCQSWATHQSLCSIDSRDSRSYRVTPEAPQIWLHVKGTRKCNSALNPFLKVSCFQPLATSTQSLKVSKETEMTELVCIHLCKFCLAV